MSYNSSYREVNNILSAGLFLAIGKPFLPPQGPAWAIIFIWVVSGTCGYVVDKVSPPVAAHAHMADLQLYFT